MPDNRDLSNRKPVTWKPGVLSNRQIAKLVEMGRITHEGVTTEEFAKGIDPSSFDLHVSEECYKMVQGAIKPKQESSYRERVLSDERYVKRYPQNKDGQFLLEKGNTYVFRLCEKLKNNHLFSGKATGKSTIGRIDILTRLIADQGSGEYDTVVRDGEKYELFAEVTPITF
ncbi:MAG: 2'-deoxycytidine 5'-triphosphate deaminase, partial [Candidatus Marinimicrobia bacterium]|nr:2'-deoxycytidine 5'-triphosphate deaminase [Candidatus Neomarinimicrobiota bacterium]